MVVVLPAPFGPSSPKHSPAPHLEVEPVHRDDVVVALDQAAREQGGSGPGGMRTRDDRTVHRIRFGNGRQGHVESDEVPSTSSSRT